MPNFDQSGRAGASPCSCWYDRVVYLRVETCAESAWAFENTPSAKPLSQSMPVGNGGEHDDPEEPAARMAAKTPVAATCSYLQLIACQTGEKLTEMGTFRDADGSSASGLKLVPFVRNPEADFILFLISLLDL